MMRRLALSLALLAAIAPAQGAAPKQPQKPDPSRRPAAETRTVVAKFADCVVKRRSALAAKIVMEDIPNRDVIRKYHQLIDAGCLTKSTNVDSPMLTLPGGNMHYALAEALVRRDMATFAPFDAAPVPPLSLKQVEASWFTPKPGKKYKQSQLERLERSHKIAQAELFMRQFGQCVIRVDPQGTHHLLLTEVTTPMERSAFKSLQPALSRCLPAGQQFKADITLIRGSLAFNYYRLARAARGTPVKTIASSGGGDR